MQTISNTDEGNIIRVAGDRDMSAFTDLILTFTNPNDGVIIVKSFLVGAKVTLGTVQIEADDEDNDLGEILLANTYVDYVIETPFPFDVDFDLETIWPVLLTYENTTPTPDVRISGKYPGRFKVCEGG